ncbi:MAG: hypothetical protein XU11_C0024G0005 [Candidatus Dadabacteria bacterium CSP1-2]|nr:MAG: hypothetical protein XU11_C0024G0005 [Candidatus Dadabacteria bacterium CSP1-2]
MWGNNTVSSLDFILLQINKQNIKNLVGAASSRDFRSHQACPEHTKSILRQAQDERVTCLKVCFECAEGMALLPLRGAHLNRDAKFCVSTGHKENFKMETV